MPNSTQSTWENKVSHYQAVLYSVFGVGTAVLGFELRASNIPGRWLYHLSHDSSPFCFGLCFRVSWLALDHDSPSYVSQVARIRGVPHHTWLVC
jgi:hypothetical protein